jgi:hypothetical protein
MLVQAMTSINQITPVKRTQIFMSAMRISTLRISFGQV